MDPERVAPDTYCVDTHLMGMPGAAAAYAIDAAEPTVVDAGGADSPEYIVDALADLGIEAEAVEHVLISHVHLDHAAGAGGLARECPNATVHVHENGLPYLTDEAKLDALKESVDRAVGRDDAFGVPELVPESRTSDLHDGDEIDLGDRVLKCIDAPGHAPHHVAAFDTESRALFSIDSAGMHIGGVLYPTTPPPAFDLEANVATCDRLAAFDPVVNCYGHYGAGTDDPLGELERYPAVLREWVNVVESGRDAHGEDVNAIVADLDSRWRSFTVRRDVAGVLQWLD